MRPSIDNYYIAQAFLAAERAGCPRRKVGAIITDKKNRVLSVGYNSPPRDLPTCLEVPCGAEVYNTACVTAAHSEISALIACRDIQSAHNIYITCSPCPDCTRAIMASPIKRIIFAEYHKTWDISKTIWTGETTYMKEWDPTINNCRIHIEWPENEV